MAVTLLEAANLTQETLHIGLIEELIKNSPLIKRLPFVTAVGSATKIVREDEDNPPGIQFVAPGEEITESTGKTDTQTFNLTILIGDADVPTFIEQTQSNKMGQMKTQVKMKLKQVAHKFEETFVYGDEDNDNEFDGLQNSAMCVSGQRLCLGSSGTGATLTLYALHHLVDTVRGGPPDMLMLNRAIMRRLTVKLAGVGSYQTQRDEYGDLWAYWRGIPLIPSDWITQTEAVSATVYSAKTGGVTSSIIALRFGEGDGVCGLQNATITTEKFEKLESKDAKRTRIKWYVGSIIYSTKSLAILSGITDAAMA